LVNDLPLKHLVNRYRCKDGSFRWMEWKSIGCPHKERVYCVARDITAQLAAEQEKERAQAQLVLAERMATIGRLAGGVGHEINNPLAYITANLGVVREELREVRARGVEISPELDPCLDEALQGAQRIKAIVAGLQTFSRHNEKRALTELRPVLELSLAMVAAELRPRARLVEDYRDAPAVNADSARLGQVFMNILTNAIQAIEPGEPHIHELRVTTSTDASGRAVVEVRDTGIGIPESILPRVFEPFFTTRPPGQGVGLGLWICHSMVSSMNGEVGIESHTGRGTTVRVVLPGASPD
jgi:signal transduction histidine kinase